MKKKRLDTSSFLVSDENLALKGEIKSGKGEYIEMAICFALWILSLAGDCFLVGAAYYLKDQIKVTVYYIPVFIVCMVVHIVPFAFWLMSILRRMSKKASKWYALTSKRLVVVTETKPQSLKIVNFSDITSYQIFENSIALYFGEERFAIKDMENFPLFREKFEQLINEEESSIEEENAQKEETTEE